MSEWVSIRDAAERLGVSPDAVRRRLRSGQLQGKQQPTPQGHVWLVELGEAGGAQAAPGFTANGHGPPPSAGHQAPGAGRYVPGATRYAPDGANRQAAVPGDDEQDVEPPSVTAALVAAQRAEEMARYTATLLEPWRQRVEEQAEEIGRLKTKLDHATEELAGRDATAEEVGRLKAELEQARQQLAAFEAATDEPEREGEAAEAEAASRPWWRFW
jgi:hypothetical protein